MKLSYPFLLTQHLLFSPSILEGELFLCSEQFPQPFLFWLSHFSTLLLLVTSFFADSLLFVIFCPCCPLPVPWLGTSLAALPAGLRGQGATEGEEGRLARSCSWGRVSLWVSYISLTCTANHQKRRQLRKTRNIEDKAMGYSIGFAVVNMSMAWNAVKFNKDSD